VKTPVPYVLPGRRPICGPRIPLAADIHTTPTYLGPFWTNTWSIGNGYELVRDASPKSRFFPGYLCAER
jgi:hypothetical protein